MASETGARELARTLVDRLLAADPFSGTALGLREYDALVPDPSRAAEDALGAELDGMGAEASALTSDDAADAVTIEVVRAVCDHRRQSLENRSVEYTVTPMPLTGPPALLATLARTVLPDAQAAADYLARVKGSSGWIDATTARLGEGAARGRYPVGSLLDAALAWTDRTLTQPVPPAITTPTAPSGWDGATAWQDELERIARDDIVPAIGRWRERLVELRPEARPDDAAGLARLPGGEADYHRAIAVH